MAKMPWYKWTPGLGFNDIRWRKLTLEQEGYYRRMYDLASLSTPASKRGFLYDKGHPIALSDAHEFLLVPHEKGKILIQSLIDVSLITRNKAGAYGFPSFAKHQRATSLQKRKTSQPQKSKRYKSDTKVIQIRDVEEELRVKKKNKEHRQSRPKIVSEELRQVAFGVYGFIPQANLLQWLTDHEEKWVYEALRLTEAAEKKMATYTNGILRRWAADGYPERKHKPKQEREQAKEKDGKHKKYLQEQFAKGEDFVKTGKGTFRGWLITKGFSTTEAMAMEKQWVRKHGEKNLREEISGERWDEIMGPMRDKFGLKKQEEKKDV